MDPKLVKVLSMALALIVYAGAAYLGDAEMEARARELAMLLFGWQGMRRAGDLGPIPGER